MAEDSAVGAHLETVAVAAAAAAAAADSAVAAGMGSVVVG